MTNSSPITTPDGSPAPSRAPSSSACQTPTTSRRWKRPMRSTGRCWRSWAYEATAQLSTRRAQRPAWTGSSPRKRGLEIFRHGEHGGHGKSLSVSSVANRRRPTACRLSARLTERRPRIMLTQAQRAATMHDTIIRGGKIYDGSGAEPVTGDVAIRDGVIVAAGGRIAEPARQEIDADGAIVTPAWVDIHTHYDGQATWDEAMEPSAGHGVGTVIMGNCGVGFAPVQPHGEQDLIDLMEGVEDIPGAALHEGMPWGAWETFPQYLDYLATRRYALNVASMIAHGAVRNYVMGDARGNADATEAEVGRIAAIVEEALRAGAVGFSTSRIMGHRSIHGEQVPGTFAPEAELMAIAGAFRRVGAGLLQLIPAGTLGMMGEHSALEDEVAMISRLSAAAGRPATFTLFETFADPTQAHRIVAQVKDGNRAGARVFPQVGSRPTGFVFSLASYHPFMAKPSYLALAHLPPAERARALRDPAIKARILTEGNVTPTTIGSMEALIPNVPFPMHQTFPLPTEATYEPLAEESFQARAQAQGLEDGRSALY